MSVRGPRVLGALVLATVAAGCDTPTDGAPDPLVTHPLTPSACGDTRLGPPSFPDAGARAAVVDVTHVHAAFTLDFTRQVVGARATMRFLTGPEAAHAVFDLARPIERAWLDGEALRVGRDLVRRDPRLRKPGSVLVVRRALLPCSVHELEVEYEIRRASPRQMYPRWTEPAVFVADLHDGKDRGLLETVAPAPLTLADTFSLVFDVSLLEPPAEFEIFTNGSLSRRGRHAWRVTWPDDSDVMTPLMVVARSDEWRTVDDPSGLVELRWSNLYEGHGLAGTGLSHPSEALPIAQAAVAELAARFGPRRLGDRPLLVLLTPIDAGGMEYPNGAIVSFPAPYVIRHEIIHSWLGRTLAPARHMDAWFDEGITTLLTDPDANWLPYDPWDDDATPIASSDPWLRRTADNAHHRGGRVFATLVERFGQDAIDGVLAWLVAHCSGAHVTHHDLRRVFGALGDRDFVDTLFRRWVIAEGAHDIGGTCAAIDPAW